MIFLVVLSHVFPCLVQNLTPTHKITTNLQSRDIPADSIQNLDSSQREGTDTPSITEHSSSSGSDSSMDSSSTDDLDSESDSGNEDINMDPQGPPQSPPLIESIVKPLRPGNLACKLQKEFFH